MAILAMLDHGQDARATAGRTPALRSASSLCLAMCSEIAGRMNLLFSSLIALTCVFAVAAQAPEENSLAARRARLRV